MNPPRDNGPLSLRRAPWACALLVLLASARAPLYAQTGGKSAPPPAEPPARPQPNSADALLQQAKDAMDKNDFAAALDPLQKVLAQRPNDPYTHFQLGYAYAELKRPQDAKTEFSRAIAIEPMMAPAHLNLGLILMDQDAAAAAQEFRRAAELQPSDSRPRYLAGLALERAGKLEDAAAEYRSALLLSPKDYEVHFALGRALLIDSKPADAEAEFRDAIAERTDSAPAHLGLANSLQAEKKFAAAADEYAAYLKLNPADAAARLDRVSALLEVDRLDAAAAELDRADAAGATPESLKMRAEVDMRQKNWQEAKKVLLQAAPLASQDADLPAWLGHAEIELREYPAAVQALRQALSLDAENAAALQDLANAAFLNQNYGEALEAMDTLAKKATPPAGSWFVRAICYDKLSRVSEAIEAYQKFLDLDQGQNQSQDFQARGRIVALQHELAQSPRKNK